MAALPEPQHSTARAIYEWYERNNDGGLRPHLGASLIGHHCERHLWLTFRWAARANLPGRVLRLFSTGQREEERIVAELRAIGCEVWDTDENGRQWRVSSFAGHFAGSMDAALKGLPEAPNTFHVGEFKTHNNKSFTDLVKNGVEQSKPQHYAQMMIYMGLTGMERALYFAVNKDNDEIYTERVKFDKAAFERLLQRAERIIFSDEPPPRITNDPSWFLCKFCDHHALCHGEQAPLPTCRSCAHVTPTRDGRWHCERHNQYPGTGPQQSGCASHRYIPILLEPFAEMVDASQEENWVRYRHKATGNEFTNADYPSGFTSDEIHACQDKAALVDNDATLQTLRHDMGGKITG